MYNSLRGLGLQAFYSHHRGEPLRPALDAAADKSYHYLDSPAMRTKLVTELAPQHHRVQLYLANIHCAACVWLLEKLPAVLTGVLYTRVHFTRAEITVDFDPAQVKVSAIAQLLSAVGYPPVPVDKGEVSRQEQALERRMLWRIGIAGFCAANSMLLAVSLFQSFFTGIESPYGHFLRWLSVLIATPAVFYCALPFYQTALSSLALGSLHIDLPISLAILATYGAGLASTWNGGEYVYFDSVTALIFLLLVGRFLQRKAVARAANIAKRSWEFLESTARRVTAHGVEECALDDLHIGDRVEVRPHERVPADGSIESGRSSLDCSIMSGESIPVAAIPGSSVTAGTLNLESTLIIRVAAVGDATRIGKIFKLVRAHHSERTAIENEANRLSIWFVAGVLMLALCAYVAWQWIDPARAFDVTVALLIVTCPCALGLAVPAAITVALGQAARAGILVKRPDALERLARIEHFYFDKTGTLTTGELQVVERHGMTALAWGLAKGLAQITHTHPASAAILRVPNVKAAASSLADPVHHAGRGMSARLADGAIVLMGSSRWMQEQSVILTPEQTAVLNSWEMRGLSPLILAFNGSALGLLALADTVRPDAERILSALQADGLSTFILSGDHPAVVSEVARLCQVPDAAARGALYPEDKAEILRSDAAKKAMVGDGVNDALAMRAADLAIGLRGQIESTMEVADIFIVEGGIAGFERARAGAKKTLRTIHRNLALSVTYNLIGATAALCGLVNPLVAALLMPASSLTVILSSIYSHSFDRKG